MHFTLATAAVLLPLAARAADIAVSVGANGLLFEPTSVEAEVGDVVVFTFYPKNHTVTQSTFDEPCTPAPNGAHSGFRFLEAVDEAAPEVWRFSVENTSATWFYCAQEAPVNHCNSGMVFAINPTEERTFEAFAAAAESATAGPLPAEPSGSEEPDSPSGSNTPTGSGAGSQPSDAPGGADGEDADADGAIRTSAALPVLAAALLGLAL
ncbi:hypothetical protein CC1G_01219 [Coprinopsis cinerea okayama7|uniref:Phytocyanin domain-containing protein n=1 Tax=Coprinopsis cinerea (strain Okayama-7 / 130 / ATCC MYA-4618 / FGSC 9003) TaxID=240176 RepID=A8NEX7_COPC7|nr:hypothetical protein CC1G_01219 [Coprinopsis cinerea okayama7\|eukprot:XP_001833157.1 hypothetical protein CC1G_01219 [Coprinopsis cinerea okayama7\